MCIIIVCLNSTLIISSEYYIPVPDTSAFSSQEMVEETFFGNKVSQDILLMVKENPKAILIGVTGIGISLILTYGMTGALQQMARDKYKGLKKRQRINWLKREKIFL